jgi:hypothetical protein
MMNIRLTLVAKNRLGPLDRASQGVNQSYWLTRPDLRRRPTNSIGPGRSKNDRASSDSLTSGIQDNDNMLDTVGSTCIYHSSEAILSMGIKSRSQKAVLRRSS